DGTPGVHACSRGLAAAVLALALGSEEGAPPVVLAVEAEPWAIAGDSVALAEYLMVVASRAQTLLREQGRMGAEQAAELVRRHLGTCLDACHSAVEFETVERALDLARYQGALGKLQYSSALRLEQPADHAKGREALLALDEPRFLHQVNGRAPGELLRAPDLDALANDLSDAETAGPWLACDEWRCHFHVPVHLEGLAGLRTTQAYADSLLRALLGDPDLWGIRELHVEIETYTWSILPGSESQPLVEGMQREYEHVLGLLDDAGWTYVG
ncbi:MAG TPA: hypothetical protein P5218_14565, partial [Planctomycetota bacterium]|nr:hypothetical protein [Planctomycetota bacterium]